MTGRERIKASLSGEETDRLCWSPLMDGYFTASLPGMGYGELDVPGAVRLAGGDILERHCPALRRIEHPSIVREARDEGSRRLEWIETPLGRLETELHSSTLGRTQYISRHPVHNADDVRILQYIIENTCWEPDFQAFADRERIVGDRGMATASGPLTPLTDFLEYQAGVEMTVYLLADHPREMAACFETVHENNLKAYRLLAESPAELIIAYEDTSSTVISPEFYRKYCSPLIDRYASICRSAGKWFITHMCGKLSAFHGQIRQGLQHGVDSVCPPPSGDVWAHEARQAWGPEKVVIGGIEPAALVRMSPDQTRLYVKRVLDAMPTFRRFILSTGDATPYGTPVENLQAVAEIVESYPWK